MDEDRVVVRMSPLCRAVSHQGKTAQVDIYEDGEGGWLLEVVDAHNNSTVWDSPFDTDQSALKEALRFLSGAAAIIVDSRLDKITLDGLLMNLN